MVTQKSFHDVMLPFSHTDEGREMIDRFLTTCQQVYPNYVDEIRGIAEGAGIMFMDVRIQAN